jgi:dipeptidyl aminopeptidase/acylaminoacyl peptidase
MKFSRSLGTLLSLLPLPLSASPRETLDLIFATQQFQDVALAPDAARVAWVESRPNADRTRSENAAIYVRDVTGGQLRRITAGDGAKLGDEHGPSWSPDSGQLAFLSDIAQKGQLQLYLVPATGGEARSLTSLTGYVEKAKWSPDGRTIAVLNIAESQARAAPSRTCSRAPSIGSTITCAERHADACVLSQGCVRAPFDHRDLYRVIHGEARDHGTREDRDHLRPGQRRESG